MSTNPTADSTPQLTRRRFVQGSLMAAVLGRDPSGAIIRKAGVMGVVFAGGEVRPGDPIRIEPPPEPHLPLAPV